MPLSPEKRKKILKAIFKKCESCDLGDESDTAPHTYSGSCLMCRPKMARSPTPSPPKHNDDKPDGRAGKSRRYKRGKRSRRKAKRGGNKYKRRTRRRN